MPIGVQGLFYSIDVTMLIDKTGSMSPILAVVKKNALEFYKKFVAKMEEEGKHVEALRIKVIGFGDYGCDSRPMMISRFFNLPDENAEFEEYLNGITAEGGGDLPENSLEALAHAIKSDWTEDGNVRRHVVMLFTDTSALEIGARAVANDDEPMTMPSSLAELGDWWNGMEDRAKRLIIFAPAAYPWEDIALSWDNVIHTPSAAGTGCDDVDIDEAIKILVQSVGTITQ